MAHLEKIDQIAYMRFASVYRQFADVNSFMQEIQNMLDKGKGKVNKKVWYGLLGVVIALPILLIAAGLLVLPMRYSVR